MTGRRGIEGVAVIGMACRFPGAPTVDAFWELLRTGREAIQRFTAEELRAAGIPASLVDDPLYVRARGMLPDVDQFDAGFFGLSPREASLLDPQHRLWLECAWEAMEDGGYHGPTCGKAVGVFAGCRLSSYLLHNLCADRGRVERLASADDPEAYQILLGNDKDLLATRTSYLLDLHGPSVAVQTACSSSLVAVAQACQSLLAYQSDLCLAGGACVVVPSVRGYRYQESGIASPDGRCRAFDARAQGTVFSDGVGAVLLKRADEAVADGDAVYAVIRGFAVNNDGRVKMSFAAPSVDGQADVVALAQAVAGVEPRSVTYVEAHGTGTVLGDPIEVAALTKAFRLGTDATGFCGLGSVKTNIGHTDAAAGIAGLIKVVLALEHRRIPPTLHFETPNPAIDLERSPFFVVRQLLPWERDGTPRRAGVSSLGVGGTNCHVVVEEAPPAESPSPVAERPRHLLTLSARSGAELRELSQRYAGRLSSLAEESLPDFCFTANTGRATFRHAVAIDAGTVAELRERLVTFAAGGAGGAERIEGPPIAFLFTGQGAHYPGMGRDLYATQPVFREMLDRCDALLCSTLDSFLAHLLYQDPAGGSRLDRADYSQPALFAVEMALAELWRSWGITPDVVLGHSIGELAAACVAGVFTLEEGLRLVAERGRLMHALPEPGIMAVVLASEDQVRRVVSAQGDAVAVAAVNGPGHAVVSGAKGAVEAVLALLRDEGVECRQLRVSHAFHSPVMDPVLDPFHLAAATVHYALPRIDFVSSVAGAPVSQEIATPAYWRDQIRRPVRFTEALAALERRGPALLVEIGPQPVLLGMARLCSSGYARAMVPSLHRNRPDWDVLLESLGKLYQGGARVDWRGFDAPYRRRRLHLPTYPFQRRRHWVDPPAQVVPPAAGDPATPHPLPGRRLPLPLSAEIRFETRLSVRSVPHLDDHRLFGSMVFAASSGLALFLSAVEAAFGSRGCVLEDLAFLRPLVVPDDGARVVQTVLVQVPDEEDTFALQLLSRADSSEPHVADAWTLHAAGRLRLAAGLPAEKLELQTLRPPGVPAVSGRSFYEETWGPGEDTGPAFRWIETIWRWEREAVAQAADPGLADGAERHVLSPGAIEAGFQALFYGGQFESRALVEQGVVYVPFTIERFTFHGRPSGRRLWCHGRARENYALDVPAKTGDVRMFDDDGRAIAEMTGFTVRRLRRDAVRDSGAVPDNLLYRIAWEPQALEVGGNPVRGDWLVCGGSPDVAGAPLVAMLEERGARCTVIERPDPDSLRVLVQRRGQPPLRGILYLSDTGQSVDAECAALLQLVQVLASEPAPPRVWLLTRHTQAVLADDAVSGARQAALWGMGRVVARESPSLGFTCVDLDDGAWQLPGSLLEELEAAGEGEVAFRQGGRYVPRLLPYRLPQPTAGTAPSFREDLAYLVTDGLSSQGRAVAEWLVRHGARHLILTTANSSASHATGPAPVLPGASVRLLATDSRRPDEIGGRLRGLLSATPPLGGIVHLDVPMDDGVLARQTPGRLGAALAGADLGWLLHEETRASKLDFFVCFSTSAALLGTPGQSSYAAAGASLDALARHRRAQGLPGLSVNWGPWAEVGKAAELPSVLRQRLRGQGFTPLPTRKALEVLGALLGSDLGQVGVLQVAWPVYLATRGAGEPASLFERLAGANRVAPRTDAPPVEATDSRDPLVSYLRLKVAEVLGVPGSEIREDVALTDLGLDSLGAMVLANRVRDDLGKGVSMATIIESPSIQAISSAISAMTTEPHGSMRSSRVSP